MLAVNPAFKTSMPNHTVFTVKLQPLQQAFMDFVEPLIEDCCRHLDKHMALQLATKKNQLTRTDLDSIMTTINQRKQRLKLDYLARIDTIFNAQEQNLPGIGSDFQMALSQHESVEENYAVQMLHKHLEHIFHDDLRALNRKIADILEQPTLKPENNPFHCSHLVNALVMAVQDWDIKAIYKIALYKAFQEEVFNQLKVAYQAVLELSITESLDAKVFNQTLKSVEVMTSEISEVDDFIQNRPSEQKPDAESGSNSDDASSMAGEDSQLTHYEVINALEIMRQFQDEMADDLSYPPLKQEVQDKLMDLYAGEVLLEPKIEQQLDAVDAIFGFIEKQESLAQDSRKLLIRMKVAFAELALANRGFFDETGIGYRFLNLLLTCLQFIQPEKEAYRPLFDKLSRLINKVCNESAFGIAEMEECYAKLSIESEKLDHRHTVLRQRTVQLEQNRAMLVKARRAVKSEIDRAVENKPVPKVVRQFLYQVWLDLLLVVYLRQSEEPDAWLKAIKTMQDLIASVIPPDNVQQKKALYQLLPVVIKDVREGLKRISYDKHQQSRFFKELAVLHLMIMNNKPVTIAGENEPEVSTLEQVDEALDENLSKSMLLNDLKPGHWMLFQQGEEPEWGQLSWIDLDGGHYLFTEKSGVKLALMNKKELIEQMDQQKARHIPMETMSLDQEVKRIYGS
jgi:hypothetical protein